MGTRRPHFPDGEVFEMTLNGDAPENQPLVMVRGDGYDHPKQWRHNGPTVKGAQTRRFKWVGVGDCRTFNEVLEKLAPHGKIPEGQWREAVKAMFEPDGVHPRGIADASWVDPGDGARFPCVVSVGGSGFDWAGGGWGVDWRWLVKASE